MNKKTKRTEIKHAKSSNKYFYEAILRTKYKKI